WERHKPAMRNWLLHPVVFYPLIAVASAAVIVVSLEPQKWPRQPAQVAGAIQNGRLVLEGDAFNTPDTGAEQNLTVDRDLLGHAHSLRIAVLPTQPAPTPAETGARILLKPQSVTALGDGPVTVLVTYKPIAINTASGLAVSLQGIGPADWVTQSIQPQA